MGVRYSVMIVTNRQYICSTIVFARESIVVMADNRNGKIEFVCVHQIKNIFIRLPDRIVKTFRN